MRRTTPDSEAEFSSEDERPWPMATTFGSLPRKENSVPGFEKNIWSTSLSRGSFKLSEQARRNAAREARTRTPDNILVGAANTLSPATNSVHGPALLPSTIPLQPTAKLGRSLSPSQGRPVGSTSKPKTTSIVSSSLPQQPQLDALHNTHDGHEQDFPRPPSSKILPYMYQGVRPPTPSYPFEARLPMPPASGVATQETSRGSDESPVQDLYQPVQEPQIEQGFVGLSLQPPAVERQGYGGGQYPHVQAEQSPDPVQSVVPRQQQRPQHHGHQHVQYAQAVPSFQPQQEVIPQQPQQYPSQVQQHVVPQLQSTYSEQQEQQTTRRQVYLLSQEQQQQQPLQSPVQVRPDLQAVHDPATRTHLYTAEPLQKYTGGDYELPRVREQSAATPWRSQPASQPVVAMAKGKLPTGIDDRKAESSASDGHQERRGLRDQFSSSLFGRSASFEGDSRQELSPSHDSASVFGPSQVAANYAPETLRHESLGPDTISSTGSDQVLKSSIPAGRISSNDTPRPPTPQTAMPIFTQAREDLERLQADIADLSDSSDASTEESGSDLRMTKLSLSEEECSDHTTNNVREETSVGSSGSQGLRTNTGEEASSSGGSPAQKRSQLDDHNKDHARAEIGVSRKRTKLSSLRFVCCFHNGPGRKCSGTDDSISEVLKKLSEQHDTHVCDRCWVLKVKDESSGLFVHPNDDQSCIDHCLSPQCHKTSSSIGNRHEFDPKICGTKTSRVRPGDGEAIYRFVFRLVHPELMCPASVLTAEHILHLDVVPRQSRRKLNKEEITARANDLEIRLGAGEQENAAHAIRIELLERNLAAAHLATTRAEEKNAALEKQSRRIVAMLSDALRTGVFLNNLDHQSLLRRVEEDAPGALIHQSQSLLTPPESNRSRDPSATPVRVDAAGQDLFSRPAAYEESTRVASLQTMPRDHAVDGNMSDPWANDPDMDRIWDSLVDELGDGGTTSSQPQRIDNFDRWWTE